jgi:hypothetical protein
LGHRADLITGTSTLVGHGVTPAPGLAVEVRQVGERARRKEGMTDILDGALDASFLGAAKGPARLGGEVIVAAQFEQPRLKVDGVTTAFEDDGFEIVIENDSGTAAPLTKGMDVAQQKVLQGLIEKELEIEGAAVGECEHEAGQATLRTADSDLTKAGPVSLRLLGGEGGKAQEGFLFGWAQSSHDAPQLDHTAAITAVVQHLEETGSS